MSCRYNTLSRVFSFVICVFFLLQTNLFVCRLFLYYTFVCRLFFTQKMNYNRLFGAAIEDLENQEIAVVNQRRFHLRTDPFLDLSDYFFIKNYRLSKDLTNQLIEMLTPFMTQHRRLSAISIKTKVLVALNFYATGSYQTCIGQNLHAALSQSSVSRCVTEVTDALNQPPIFNVWVHFPVNIQEMNILRQRFYNKFHLSGVIGCIDCTHIAIIPPPVNHPDHPEHIFVNRKNYHSLNVQLICDPDLYIMHVNASFPGSCHDSHIWNNSNVQETLREIYNRMGEGYFLLGYSLRPWLLTPVANPQDNVEENYNAVHKSTRSTIERCNGTLKMRFRCLLKHRVLHYAPNKASKIVKACVMLHNMCIRNDIELLNEENVDLEDLGAININAEE